MAKPTYEELFEFVKTIPKLLEGYWFSGEAGEYNNDGVIEVAQKAARLTRGESENRASKT